MLASDFSGLYAIIPTPSKDGSEKLGATDTVDLAESAALVENLIRDGASGIIALGTTGECATLSPADYRKFVGCILETAKKRVPMLMGSTSLSGHDIADRVAFLRENKADGTLLGLPMWQPATTDMALGFYQQVSELFPTMAVMVYANARAFRYKFPPEFWEALSKKAPTVTSAKFSRPQNLPDLIARSNNRIHFMPNESTVHNFHEIAPATTTSCWATAAAMGPAPAIKIIEAVQAGNKIAIKALSDEIAWANDPIKPIFSNPEIFGSYNIQVEKERINAAGYCRCGPVRPPYNYIPAEYAQAAAECGKRWSSLQIKYAAKEAAE